jgi:hypothetical protein
MITSHYNNYSKARAFLEMMMKGRSFPGVTCRRRGLTFLRIGNPEYGCFISHEKTRTNFEFGSDPSMVTEPDQKGQGRSTSPLHSPAHSMIRFPLVWLRDKHE